MASVKAKAQQLVLFWSSVGIESSRRVGQQNGVCLPKRASLLLPGLEASSGGGTEMWRVCCSVHLHKTQELHSQNNEIQTRSVEEGQLRL